MYDKLREMIQEQLDTGEFTLKIEDSSFRTLPTYLFSFGDDKLFHHVRIYFRVYMIHEKRHIDIDIPDMFVIRAGIFNKEEVSSDHIHEQIKDMKVRLRNHILTEWDEYEQKKAKRVNRLINILYNLWKTKKG